LLYPSPRLTSAALTLALLSGCAGPLTHRPGAAASAHLAQTAKKSAWSHEASDLTPDPRARFGTLPNGMRYMIMKNATPPGAASLRLHISAGSLMEEDDQQGLAHLVEHMAFNGSTNVPEGEALKMLERHGLAYGSNVNAGTDFQQTVYQFDLPKAGEAAMDDSLTVLRETAGNLLLSPDSIGRERGIIAAEEKSRDTGDLRLLFEQYRFFLNGQLAPRRFPIGQAEVIKNAAPQRLVDYYRGHYRPERTTLIVVGDMDVDRIEAKIRSRFSDWEGQGPAVPDPDLGKVAERGRDIRLYVDPAAPTAVRIGWVSPPDTVRDSRAKRRETILRSLGFAVLNRRLGRIARGDNPPFLGAGGGRSTQAKSADLTLMSAVVAPAKWREALSALEQEQRRMVAFGVTAPELERETRALRAVHAAAADAAATRGTVALAEEAVRSVDEERVFVSPADRLALFDEAVRGLRPEAVSAIMRDQFEGSGPLVLVSSPTAVDGGEAAVRQALDNSIKVAVAPPVATPAPSWASTDFGVPGKVAERREAADLGATFIRFENGVRLTVRPSDFADEEVLTSVRAFHGLLDHKKTSPSSAWGAGQAFVEGGVNGLSLEEITEALSPKIYSTGFAIGEDALVLDGKTRPADFATQLQVLAAYVTAPGWRPQAWETMRVHGSGTWHDSLASTPNGVFLREAHRRLRSGDKRFGIPSREEIAAYTSADFRAALEGTLARGPIEVIVTGDIGVDQAIAQTAATFGALPKREASPASPEARKVSFPERQAAPVTVTHKGRADQALAMIAWPTNDFFADPVERVAGQLIQAILQLRLNEDVREKRAGTYSPGSENSSSKSLPGYGYISAWVETAPDAIDAFYADIARISKELRDKPVGADELARARTPRLEGLQKAKASNNYWVGALAGVQDDPRRLESVRQAAPLLEKVTAADIQAFARRYLRDEKAWRMIVLPEAPDRRPR